MREWAIIEEHYGVSWEFFVKAEMVCMCVIGRSLQERKIDVLGESG
jgi:hypothetical protein